MVRGARLHSQGLPSERDELLAYGLLDESRLRRIGRDAEIRHYIVKGEDVGFDEKLCCIGCQMMGACGVGGDLL